MIKVIYSVFLGILLSIFLGVGISVFYPAPEGPTEPDSIRYGYESEPTQKQQAEMQKFERARQDFETNQMNTYNRNVSIIALVFAITLLAVSIIWMEHIDVISDGLLIGGVFTLLYGMGRGLATEDDVFRFVVISICLAIALTLGYWKFVKTTETTASKQK